MSQGRSTRSSAWSGWVVFAACVLIVLGVLNFFEGFTALFKDGYYQTASGDLLVWNYNAWGGILIAFGALQVLIGFGLMTAKGWARWAAIFLAMLNIIGQIGFLAAHPVWTTIVIALDVFVLWALTAHWDDAMGRGGGRGAAEWESTGAGTRAGRR